MKTFKTTSLTKVTKELYLLEKGEMSSIRGGNRPNDTPQKDQDELE